jgi:2-keto-4-pentenoate hydratase/2-oxohepta-3-ene-1,7-dioic acid hydratase in catechol pathway
MTDENLWKTVIDALKERGIALEGQCCDAADPSKIKVVCVAANLAESMREVGDSPRDQVIMARVDGKTAGELDAWIAAGAAKSRSEAAALFIREGLKVRAAELAELQDAVQDVQKAQERLRKRARGVFGDDE